MTRRFESYAISSTLKEYSLLIVPDGILVTVEPDGFGRSRGRSYPRYRVWMYNQNTGMRIRSKKRWALATAKKKAQYLAWEPSWLADVGWFNAE